MSAAETEVNEDAGAEGTRAEHDIEQQARKMGWRPKGEFPGGEQNFIDAKEYVERGRNMLPIIKANNAKLERDLAAERAERAKMQRELQEQRDAVAELRQVQRDATAAAHASRGEALKRELVAAKEGNDAEREVELEDQLARHRAAAPAPASREGRETPPRAGTAETTAAPTANEAAARSKAEFEAWVADNDWYGTDFNKTAIANAMGPKLREEGNTLQGRAFFDEVKRRTEAALPKPASRGRGTDAVEGGGGGEGRGSSTSSGNGTSYSDMPAEARAIVEANIKGGKIKIGPQAAVFKTAKDYRDYYAGIYFREKQQ